ncbi:adenine deaminase [Crassaminicella profunda]|uniref:adenine deaminase n=1 Tax=Crassaminicella profunda TaxID=1286698 RepID=UPI001CA7AD15|nr:adenine deaminase C-terminal domain-containing protein [Crassaminicella profunda]QZY55216.1 amidohydrolase family protein [Crassaminicella profunda]
MELDLLIKNVQVYNAYFKKFIYADVGMIEGKFIYIGQDQEFKSKEVLDGKEKYMIPGLVDIHMHIESSMTTPFQFSQAVIQHGVTTIVADPHEMANVFGLEGIEAMIHCNNQDAVDIFYGVPSSVPSTSYALETTGGSIKEDEVANLLKRDEICCLGEVMNFKDLIGDSDSLINRIIRLIKKEKPHLQIEGHCPKITGLELAKFIYQGVDADHTQQSVDTLREKIQNGMFIEIQEKSMTEENIKYLVENNLYEHFCLVTDDVMADKILKGHLNELVKKAIKMGMPIEEAIYVSTYTPARRMGLRDRGSIAPGKKADFILLEDIDEFTIQYVYKDGKKVFDGKVHYKEEEKLFPKHFYKSVNLEDVNEEDFEVIASIEDGEVICRAMKVNPHTTFTENVKEVLKVKNGKLQWEQSSNCLITVFDRYKKTKNKSFGLVTGSIIKEGAVATTYAHDHHNLMVMGQNAKDMMIATNWIIKNQGGYCVVNKGKIIASLELPVGGILSEERIDSLGKKLENIRKALKDLGYIHHNEIMSFSTLSLPVSPSLKITDKGLIDVKKQEIVDLFYEK